MDIAADASEAPVNSTENTTMMVSPMTEGCAPGYRGTACHQCDVGYARTGQAACASCADGWKNAGLAAAGGLAGLFVVAFTIRGAIASRGAPGKLEIQVAKVLMSHLQLVGLAASFEFNWPAPIVSMLSLVATASSMADSVTSVQCLLGEGWGQPPSRTYVMVFGVLAQPFIAAVVLATVWYLVGRFKPNWSPGQPAATPAGAAGTRTPACRKNCASASSVGAAPAPRWTTRMV
jgi:hypothetical protein